MIDRIIHWSIANRVLVAEWCVRAIVAKEEDQRVL